METWALEHPLMTFILLLCFIYGFKPVNIVQTQVGEGDKKDE